MILTNDEIAAICRDWPGNALQAARDIEAAILRKIGEPVAWRYQNANTDTEYLCWWKQTGGRNWTPLYKLPEVTK